MKKNMIVMGMLLAVSFSASADLSVDASVTIAKSTALVNDRREVNVNLAVAKLNNVRTSIHNYYMANNSFPASLDVLVNSGVYVGDFSTPYGLIIGVVGANSFDLKIDIPAGGSQEIITKMVASRANAVLGAGNTSFTMAVATPTASLILDNMIVRFADPSRPDNNKMFQELNFNGFDATNIKTVTASFINASESVTTKELTVSEQAKFNQGATVNSNTNTTNFVVSRLGGDSQLLQTGITDRSAEITYIEDTSAKGSGNFGVINFNLGGNSGEALVNPLKITKTGLISLGQKVITLGNDGAGSTLDADLIDGIDSTQFARRDTANTFTTTNTFNAAIQGDGGLQVDGKWVVSADGSILYENNVALVNKYLGKLAKAADSDKLDGINSTQFARTDIAEVFNSNLTVSGRIYANNGLHIQGDWLRINGASGLYFQSYGGGWHMQDTTWIRAYGGKHVYSAGMLRGDGGLQVDGKWIASADGNTLYENNVALSNKYLGKTAKAADSNLLDGIDSTSFARRDTANTFTTTNTFNAHVNANGGVKVDTKWVVSPDGNTLYENNVALSNKYKLKGASDVYTKIFSSGSLGLDRGNFRMTRSYKDFDALLVVGQNDAANSTHFNEISLKAITRGQALTGRYRQYGFQLIKSDGLYWYGYFDASGRYFTTVKENSRIREIYGITKG